MRFIMAKKSFWMAAFALLLVWSVSAQTDRRPGADGQKERAEQHRAAEVRQHAEDKSDGAAFSGRGRGGDKDLRDRDKDRHKGKGKKGRKGRKKHDGTAPTPQTHPGANGGNEPSPPSQRRPGERPTSGAEPKNTPKS
jgi:hypothetical protein